MKIFLLADPEATHTIKWANSLADKGMEILLFGLNSFNCEYYNSSVLLRGSNVADQIKTKSDGAYSKLIYLRSMFQIRKLLYEFKPDILHSHYASSYGFLGAVSSYHPLLVSVWGSDIYNFPSKSIFHKKVIKYTFKKADKILSTSRVMARQIALFTSKHIEVTPFGINILKFQNKNRVQGIFNQNDVVIGTVKSLEKKYGIEYLIKAFKVAKQKLPEISLKLLIVGSGSLEKNLKKLCYELNIENDTVFTGFVPPEVIPEYHNMIDIFVALSIEESESFGVAVLEASSCGKPVIVTNVGGLPEVVKKNVTGIIVEKFNIEEASQALIALVLNTELRLKMGEAGRKHVVENYNWEKNIMQMIDIYKLVVSGKKN